MLYLYAIIDRPSVPIALPRGVEGVMPEVLPFEDFSVIAGSLANAPARGNAAIGAHMTVLNALMQQCTVLPARFGTVFPGYDELARSMSDMRGGLRSDLVRLRGQVELGVCATQRGTQPISAAAPVGFDAGEASGAGQGPGFRYMIAKRREHEERLRAMRSNEALAERVCARFAMLASEQVWHALPVSAGRGISAAFLVPRERFGAFQLAAAELRSLEPDLEILCTGPWPPFTFVGDRGRTFAEGTAHGKVASRIAY